MKNSIKRKIIGLTCAVCAILTVFATGCGNADSSSTAESSSAAETSVAESTTAPAESTEESTVSESSATETESTESENSSAESDDLWANAQYKEDTELGQGQKTVKIEVSANDKKITFTLHTDKATLGDALTENKIVEGNTTEYGLYITAVNGMTADYDKDKAYWAISKDGKYSDTGADSTKIADGEHYELTYTKG